MFEYLRKRRQGFFLHYVVLRLWLLIKKSYMNVFIRREKVIVRLLYSIMISWDETSKFIHFYNKKHLIRNPHSICFRYFSQSSMASYSFSSPGYVNIPPYYNTTPNGYSGLNFQYPLPERMMISIVSKLAFLISSLFFSIFNNRWFIN